MRTFFAVELGARARDVAAGVARGLAARPGGDRVRWTRPENLHVTLRFLGEVDAARVPEVAAGVAAAVAGEAAFELSLGATFGLPNARRARVVALDLEPHEPLLQLAAAAERAVVAAGFAPEERAFRPHVTLGRVRNRRPPRIDAVPAPEPAPFPVREVVLFESQLGPGGSTYTALERLALQGVDHPRNEFLEDVSHGSDDH